MSHDLTQKAMSQAPAKQRKRRCRTRTAVVELHPRYDPAVPLLRELVRVTVDATDGTSFDALLTRVPGIGEEIVIENRSYQVIRLQHNIVDDDGRAYCGYHAFLDVILRSED